MPSRARTSSILAVLTVPLLLATAGWAEKIRTAIPSATIHYLSLYVAEEKGFFKEENLENETIAIGVPPASPRWSAAASTSAAPPAAACARP